MKILNYLLLLLFVMPVVPAAAQIDFYEGTFQEALKKAQEEKKGVFVDFWAGWCGPCKMMAEKVFPLPEVGEYLNARFVCIQLNIEESANAQIARQYEVNSLPTMAFLSADGKELRRVEGTVSPDVLIHEAKVALGKELSFEQLYEKYKKKKKDLRIQQQLLLGAPDFMTGQKGYERQKWGVRIEGLFADYLKNKKLEQMVNEADFTILTTYHPSTSKEDPVFDFMATHFDAFAEVVSRDAVAQYLIGMNNSYIIQLCKKGSQAFKERLGRVDGDLKEAYAGFSFGKLSVLDAITLLSDATYELYKHNLDAFFLNMDKYFAGKGEAADLEDYTQPLEDLAMAYEGKLPDAAYARCIPWIGKALEKGTDAELRTRLLVMLAQCYQHTDHPEKAKQSYNQAFLECARITEPEMKKQFQEIIQQSLQGL